MPRWNFLGSILCVYFAAVCHQVLVIQAFAAENVQSGQKGDEPMSMQLVAGQLVLTLGETGEGISVRSLVDSATGCSFFPPEPPPLFTLTVREVNSRREVKLTADAGWTSVAIAPTAQGAEMHWHRLNVENGEDLRLVAEVTADEKNHALRWGFRVSNESSEWSLMRVVFPQVKIDEIGEDAWIFLPRAPGEIQQGIWRRKYEHERVYPDPWMTMQYMASYTDDGSVGLYVATHDPMGGPKRMTVRSRPEERTVDFIFDHPVAEMSKSGNDFELTGEGVWQLFRGDWFDASMIYKDWVRGNARWFPELTKDGRSDTPEWARDVSIWCRLFGTDPDGIEFVRRFAEYIGLPVGLHWYAWHNIPPGAKDSEFDNDMPNFFPPRKGFAEGVLELREAGVYVMPYINARIWDTRDRGQEDWQFTKVALPAATKKEDGTPHTVVYGKEPDGSNMTFAVMCPATQLWQSKMLEICVRLFEEYRVNGIYLDQVAAMSPIECMDPRHGHPLGGGHWWNLGYWKMHDTIRSVMPDDVMLTTECNSEPFIRWFDGYLVWHWQRPGMVPAFVAVYGPSIQVFGRQYAGGPQKDLAFRMRCAQQLVWGEQIGWMDAQWVDDEANMEFLRHMVHMRWNLRRFFSAGELARPPIFDSHIPRVTADWKWYGEMNVTTDVVFVGAWRLPHENKAALVFVNVGDEPVSADFTFDGRGLGMQGEKVILTKISGDRRDPPEGAPITFTYRLEFPAKRAWAWEISE